MASRGEHAEFEALIEAFLSLLPPEAVIPRVGNCGDGGTVNFIDRQGIQGAVDGRAARWRLQREQRLGCRLPRLVVRLICTGKHGVTGIWRLPACCMSEEGSAGPFENSWPRLQEKRGFYASFQGWCENRRPRQFNRYLQLPSIAP